jgi:hypothetical protein
VAGASYRVVEARRLSQHPPGSLKVAATIWKDVSSIKKYRSNLIS